MKTETALKIFLFAFSGGLVGIGIALVFIYLNTL
jgi:hypothetical protein